MINRRAFLATPLLLAVPAGVARVPDLILGWDILIFGPAANGGWPGYDVFFLHRESRREWGLVVSQQYLRERDLSVREWAIQTIPTLPGSPVMEA